MGSEDHLLTCEHAHLLRSSVRVLCRLPSPPEIVGGQQRAGPFLWWDLEYGIPSPNAFGSTYSTIFFKLYMKSIPFSWAFNGIQYGIAWLLLIAGCQACCHLLCPWCLWLPFDLCPDLMLKPWTLVHKLLWRTIDGMLGAEIHWLNKNSLSDVFSHIYRIEELEGTTMAIWSNPLQESTYCLSCSQRCACIPVVTIESDISSHLC